MEINVVAYGLRDEGPCSVTDWGGGVSVGCTVGPVVP